MATFNLLVYLNAYSDTKSSNSPNLSNFRWNRDIEGVTASNPVGQAVTLDPSEVRTIFTGSIVKKFLYLEAKTACAFLINGTIAESVKPFVIGSSTQPGIFAKTSDITSLVITNPSSTDPLEVYYITIE